MITTYKLSLQINFEKQLKSIYIQIMTFIQIYNIIANDMLFVFFFYRMSSMLFYWIQNRIIYLIFKHLIYFFFFRRRTFLQIFNRWRILMFVLYWSTIIVCNVIEIKTLIKTKSRINVFSTIYIISLMFLSRLSFATDLLKLFLYNYHALHNFIKFMTFVQKLIHVLIFVFHNTLQLRNSLHFYDFLIYCNFFY